MDLVVDSYRSRGAPERELVVGTTYRDREAVFAWRYDGSTFYTFDDPEVMRGKARYVVRHGLGGVMMWSLDGDTPDGELMSALWHTLR